MRIDKMPPVHFLLPFLNVSSLYIEFNATTNAFVESKACANDVHLVYSGSQQSTAFSSSTPLFRYDTSTLYLGKNSSAPHSPIFPAADFWKLAAPQDQFVELLADECPVLVRDYLLSTQTPQVNLGVGGEPRLILYPTLGTCSSCETLDPSPMFGRYDCGGSCDGYYIFDRGHIFIEKIDDVLKIRYSSFHRCGIFGAITSHDTLVLSQPRYGTCESGDYDNISKAPSGFFSSNLAIYLEFVIILCVTLGSWRYVRAADITSPLTATTVSFNNGTWVVIYLLFGIFISTIAAIIGQGVDYLGNLVLTTLPLLIILPLFMLQLANTFSRYTQTFPSRLCILSYMMFALFPVWVFVTLDHPMLLDGNIERAFARSQNAGIVFFLCLPFGIESFINYRLIRRGFITSYHMKYASGVVYAIFGSSVLLFTASALRNWDFYIGIFDSVVSAFGFLVTFVGKGDVEKGAAAMGTLVASLAWTVALFSQPIFTTNFTSIVHWLIMTCLLVFTNYKKNHSVQTKNLNTFFSVSFAARITFRISTKFLVFSGILQSLLIGGVTFAVLYSVQFSS